MTSSQGAEKQKEHPFRCLNPYLKLGVNPESTSAQIREKYQMLVCKQRKNANNESEFNEIYACACLLLSSNLVEIFQSKMQEAKTQTKKFYFTTDRDKHGNPVTKKIRNMTEMWKAVEAGTHPYRGLDPYKELDVTKDSSDSEINKKSNKALIKTKRSVGIHKLEEMVAVHYKCRNLLKDKAAATCFYSIYKNIQTTFAVSRKCENGWLYISEIKDLTAAWIGVEIFERQDRKKGIAFSMWDQVYSTEPGSAEQKNLALDENRFKPTFDASSEPVVYNEALWLQWKLEYLPDKVTRLFQLLNREKELREEIAALSAEKDGKVAEMNILYSEAKADVVKNKETIEQLDAKLKTVNAALLEAKRECGQTVAAMSEQLAKNEEITNDREASLAKLEAQLSTNQAKLEEARNLVTKATSQILALSGLSKSHMESKLKLEIAEKALEREKKGHGAMVEYLNGTKTALVEQHIERKEFLQQIQQETNDQLTEDTKEGFKRLSNQILKGMPGCSRKIETRLEAVEKQLEMLNVLAREQQRLQAVEGSKSNKDIVEQTSTETCTGVSAQIPAGLQDQLAKISVLQTENQLLVLENVQLKEVEVAKNMEIARLNEQVAQLKKVKKPIQRTATRKLQLIAIHDSAFDKAASCLKHEYTLSNISNWKKDISAIQIRAAADKARKMKPALIVGRTTTTKHFKKTTAPTTSLEADNHHPKQRKLGKKLSKRKFQN